MDPNEALRLIRLTIAQLRVDTDQTIRNAHALEIAIYFEGLDNWLTRDGVLPAAWAPEEEKAHPGWHDRVLAAVWDWSDEEFELAFGFAREQVTA